MARSRVATEVMRESWNPTVLAFIRAMPARKPARGAARPTQFANVDGEVCFETIYPGWYPGRTPHIHIKVFTDPASVVTGQLPDALSTRIYTTISPYDARKAKRDTDNSNDVIFKRQGGADTLLRLEEKGGAYLASLVIGVDPPG
jgi:hypothetical protein